MKCPINNFEECNSECALLIIHKRYENHYTQKYDYEFKCGILQKENPVNKLFKKGE